MTIDEQTTAAVICKRLGTSGTVFANVLSGNSGTSRISFWGNGMSHESTFLGGPGAWPPPPSKKNIINFGSLNWQKNVKVSNIVSVKYWFQNTWQFNSVGDIVTWSFILLQSLVDSMSKLCKIWKTYFNQIWKTYWGEDAPPPPPLAVQ